MCGYECIGDGMDGYAPGHCDMEDRLLPMQLVTPLHLADGSKGTAGLLQFGTNRVTGTAKMKLRLMSSCLRGSNSGFLLEVYSSSLFHDWILLQGSRGFKLEFSFS